MEYEYVEVVNYICSTGINCESAWFFWCCSNVKGFCRHITDRGCYLGYYWFGSWAARLDLILYCKNQKAALNKAAFIYK